MIELEPHQEAAVKKMHNGCILIGATGSGKTYTALEYYLENEAPKNIYVITTAKVRNGLDWEHAALQVGITPDPETTLASVICVDSWNNIGKYGEVKDAFFIFDEQRVVGTGAWTKAFWKITKANRWVMLSATPGDTWLDYAPVFIANGFYKNITQFRYDHVEYVPRVKFPKVKAYHKVGKLVRLRNQVLVEMPYERHTERIESVIPVEYDKELFRKVVKDRWHVYENRPLTDVSELFSVMRKVVNSHTTRLEAIRTLLKTRPRLIVFYNFDYELEILRTLSLPTDTSVNSPQTPKLLTENLKFAMEQTRLYTEMRTSKTLTAGWTRKSSESDFGTESNSCDWPKTTNSFSGQSPQRQSVKISTETTSHSEPAKPSHFSVAEWNGHKHQPIPETDSWVYLVQYRAGAEGWNCIDTNAMCFYSPTYSYKDDHQAHGRIDRLNTSFFKLYYFRLLSDAWIDQAVMDSLRAKKSFNEAAHAAKMMAVSKMT